MTFYANEKDTQSINILFSLIGEARTNQLISEQQFSAIYRALIKAATCKDVKSVVVEDNLQGIHQVLAELPSSPANVVFKTKLRFYLGRFERYLTERLGLSLVNHTRYLQEALTSLNENPLLLVSCGTVLLSLKRIIVQRYQERQISRRLAIELNQQIFRIIEEMKKGDIEQAKHYSQMVSQALNEQPLLFRRFTRFVASLFCCLAICSLLVNPLFAGLSLLGAVGMAGLFIEYLYCLTRRSELEHTLSGFHQSIIGFFNNKPEFPDARSVSEFSNNTALTPKNHQELSNTLAALAVDTGYVEESCRDKIIQLFHSYAQNNPEEVAGKELVQRLLMNPVKFGGAVMGRGLPLKAYLKISKSFLQQCLDEGIAMGANEKSHQLAPAAAN